MPAAGDGLAIVALCGGVGGAKLADGLDSVMPEGALTVVVNTADDFRRYGLHVSPDVDTVLYTLAGVADPARGWGLAGDSSRVMEALRRLGDDAWFHLGDHDLATHLLRTALLDTGSPITEVTARLAAALGVRRPVLPMTDDAVSTVIVTEEGPREFQQWFVRDGCAPGAVEVMYRGAEEAALSPSARAAIAAADAVIVCPSNPYLSIGPILALRGAHEAIRSLGAAVVAVSPIMGGKAVKGPAAAMLASMAGEASSLAVARFYGDLVGTWVIDHSDADQVSGIERLGPRVYVTDTLMASVEDRRRLAGEVRDLALSASVARRSA